jgi:hypothetical protein
LTQFSDSELATQFFQTYYLHLMQETFAVMTGELKAGKEYRAQSLVSGRIPLHAQ